MTTYRRYLITCLLSALCLVLLAVAINAVIDPYRLFGWVDRPGLNQIKPRASQRAGLAKASALQRSHPAALILGNSRMEIGVDPNSANWPPDWRPVFNAGLPGSHIGTNVVSLQLALAHGHPTHLLIGLDFLDFRSRHLNPRPAEAFDPLALTPIDWPQRVKEYSSALLSLDALQDSLLTLKARHDSTAPDLRADGFNPMHDYAQIARDEGYAAMFEARARDSTLDYLHKPKQVADASTNQSAWPLVKRMLAVCRAQHLQPVFVIYPYHAQLLDLFYQAGLWPAFEQWKHEVTQLLADDGARANSPPYPLWDFSGYHAYAMEPIPLRWHSAANTMHWYWEAGHFKRELGDVMLAHIFSGKSAAPGEFGVRLTTANLSAQIEAIRAGRQSYLAQRPEEAAATAALFQRLAQDYQASKKETP